jgi:hypothetical protein
LHKAIFASPKSQDSPIITGLIFILKSKNIETIKKDFRQSTAHFRVSVSLNILIPGVQSKNYLPVERLTSKSVSDNFFDYLSM